MRLGSTIADVACGSGFGTRQLRTSGVDRVYGIDIAVSGLAEAAGSYAGSGTCFLGGDALALPLRSSSLDSVVSFETLEHLSNDGGFIAEVHRVLRCGGLFVCSTPNRAVMNPGRGLHDGSFNPHHIREYRRQEFRSLLAEKFRRPALFGQTIFPRRYVALLTLMSRLSWPLAARAHQAFKLLRSPFVGTSRHKPRPLQDGMRPEVLLAVSTKE